MHMFLLISSLPPGVADDARLALLVDTVAGAAEGLRRELGLRPGDTGTRPAELVGAGAGAAPKARVTDPAALDRLWQPQSLIPVPKAVPRMGGARACTRCRPAR